MNNTQNRLHALITIIAIGFIIQFAFLKIWLSVALDDNHYQQLSSESFMQTTSLEDLRNAPFESLNNIHIQPPGLDTIRAVLVQFWPSLDIHTALKRVDLSLYILWAILYIIIGAIIFSWLAELTNIRLAFVATLIFFLHPALIFYAILLDATLLSCVLLLWLYYLLWKTRKHYIPTPALICAVLLLFFFRSIFQLPFILVIGGTLALLKVPAHKLAIFLVITTTICGLYITKQKSQFGITSTSSFTGINLVRSIGITRYEYPYTTNSRVRTSASMPNVLTRTKKITGTYNYNNFQYLQFNRRLTNEYKAYLLNMNIKVLIDSYRENLAIYFYPSSRYGSYTILDNLPWRNVYDFLYSAPILPALLLMAGAISIAQTLKSKNFSYSLAMLLPAFYVFVICVIFEKGENNRFKFFLEPVFYIYIISQFFNLYTWICSKLFNTSCQKLTAHEK